MAARKTPRVSPTTATGNRNAIGLARRRARTKATKGGSHDVFEGFLIRYKKSTRALSAMIVDLPHEIGFVGTRYWPVESAGGGVVFEQVVQRALFLAASTSRDGFTLGSGLKALDVQDVATSTKDREVYSLSRRPDRPPRLFGLSDTVVAMADTQSIVSTGLNTTPEDADLFPMVPGRYLDVELVVVSHNRKYFTMTEVEADMAAITGRKFFCRNLGGGVENDFPLLQGEMLAPHVPEPSGAYAKGADLTVLVCPVVLSSDTTYDYGKWSLYVMLSAVNPLNPPQLEGEEKVPVSTMHVELPDIPQFETQRWTDYGEVPSEYSGRFNDKEGYTPSYLFGAATYMAATDTRPEAVVYYGIYVAELWDPGPFERSPPDLYDARLFMSTLFRLEIAGGFPPQWTVLRCSTSGISMEDRHVDASTDRGDRRLYSYPHAFFAAGDSWGVYLTHVADSFWAGKIDRIPEGNATGELEKKITVYRGGTLVEFGFPNNMRIGVSERESVLYGPRAFGATMNLRQLLFACHLDTRDHFGFSFVVIDNATDRYRLAKWDTIDGFSLWDIDLGPLGEVNPSFFYPSITCFRQQSVDDEGAVYGDPGFIVCAADMNDDAGSYTVTAGKTYFSAPVTAGAAMPLGNVLSANGTTADAYQTYTKVPED